MTEETTPVDFDLFWWPHPDAFNDLVVENTEEGFQLSAPDDTFCSEWLTYWSETPEREALFSQEFQKVLLDHLKTLEQHGESTVSDRQND